MLNESTFTALHCNSTSPWEICTYGIVWIKLQECPVTTICCYLIAMGLK